MKRPRFRQNILAFIALVALVAPVDLVLSQPPPVPAEGPVDSKKTPPAPRVKPQVIYHLPNTSSDAAALHSQAKAESHALPVESDAPTSLQLAHSNANAAAAQTTSPAPNAQDQVADDRTQRRKKSVTRTPRVRSPGGSHSAKTAAAKAPGAKNGKKH
jgi:hypothetical protein